jgi:cysteine desulfurase
MIYFDNSSTTKPYKEVADLVCRLMTEEFGNSSSMHQLGIRAEHILEETRKNLAETIKAQPQEVVFTSGGTEAINTALRGTADALKRRGMHILTSPVEHAASLETLKSLENMGYELEYLEVDQYGKILLDDLRDKIRKDTILVNIMAVNNELGTIEPIKEASEIIKLLNPNTVFHVDAVQAYGKIPISLRSIRADLMSFSSHKIHGPKGVGMLYIRQGTKVHPMMLGGGHERKFRSGTVNVPGIAGFGLAAMTKIQRMDDDQAQCRKVRETIISGLKNLMGDQIRINSPHDGVDNILSVSLKGIKAETLLHSLEMKEIYVSTGSACHSRRDSVSHVIKETGIPRVWHDGVIRFSFCGYNSVEEAEICIDAIKEIMQTLQRKR